MDSFPTPSKSLQSSTNPRPFPITPTISPPPKTKSKSPHKSPKSPPKAPPNTLKSPSKSPKSPSKSQKLPSVNIYHDPTDNALFQSEDITNPILSVDKRRKAARSSYAKKHPGDIKGVETEKILKEMSEDERTILRKTIQDLLRMINNRVEIDRRTMNIPIDRSMI